MMTKQMLNIWVPFKFRGVFVKLNKQRTLIRKIPSTDVRTMRMVVNRINQRSPLVRGFYDKNQKEFVLIKQPNLKIFETGARKKGNVRFKLFFPEL